MAVDIGRILEYFGSTSGEPDPVDISWKGGADMKPTVIVTGAGSGIGKALAIELVKRDCNVIGVGRRLKLLETTRGFNPDKIEAVSADLSSIPEWNNLITTAERARKPLHLVHCAGTIEPITLIENVPYKKWKRLIETNLEAPFFLTQALLPHLKGGRVLFLSSGLAYYAMAGFSAYCISKAALLMAWKCFNAEMKDAGILFGTAMPGVVDTPMQEKIRTTSAKDLPSVQEFIDLKSQDRLFPSRIAADFLTYVLLDTTDDEFSRIEWDIDERAYLDKWYKQVR